MKEILNQITNGKINRLIPFHICELIIHNILYHSYVIGPAPDNYSDKKQIHVLTSSI